MNLTNLFLPTDKYNKIIIHHSTLPLDNPITLEWDGILRYHVCQKNWRNIGYHFGVEMEDGEWKVVLGRPLMYDGAHCKGENDVGVGICAVGNWEKDHPPHAIYELVSDICVFCHQKLYVPPNKIFPHYEFADTDCPGKNFDMLLLRRMVEEKL